MGGNFRYVALADEIQDNILSGQFKAGEKLPSLRELHTQLGLSVSTIHQAYIELEKRGQVVAREKSGFYVRARLKTPLPSPSYVPAKTSPSKVKINALAQTILTDINSGTMLQMGATIPVKELMPVKQLSRIIKSMSAQELCQCMATYDLCQGDISLRTELSKRMLGHVSQVLADDIVTTNGCLEAVSFCLRAVASPGDTILLESPAFHCFLQLIEDLNMYVLELPGCPEQGIDPDRFERIISETKIKACLLNTNFQNPLGSVLPQRKKAAILRIANERNLPIIEDDVYGDLYFGEKRPTTFKSMDTRGNVLYCSSFSKTLAPGLRAGWTVPGRFIDQVIRLKLNTQLSCPVVTHRAAAQFLASGAYDRHLRRLRNQFKNQCSAMVMAISTYFPKNTRLTYPKGGMVIWIELDKRVDTLEIFRQARDSNISILPGRLCATTDRFAHCFRINCGIPWSDQLEQGIKRLGDLVKTRYIELGLL